MNCEGIIRTGIVAIILMIAIFWHCVQYAVDIFVPGPIFMLQLKAVFA